MTRGCEVMRSKTRVMGWKAKLVVIGVLLMFLSGFFPAFSPLLQTRKAHAQGGSISGTVTNASDQPIENVEVYAYVWDSYWDWWDYAGDALTTPDGTYEITGLEPGYYIVEFTPPSDSYYISRFYDDQSMGYLGEPGTNAFELGASEEKTGIDAVLEEGGKISGRVTSASEPGGVDGVYVNVYDLDWNYVAGAWTGVGNDGNYETSALPPGQYKVFFDPEWNSEYISEWYDNKRSFEDADPVTVVVGETTTGIDAVLERPGSISGRVTSAAEPGGARAVEVFLYPADDPDDYVDSTWTNLDNGTYSFTQVMPGDYKVLFASTWWSQEYAREWYDDKRGFDEADVITVEEGQDITGIDAYLERKGSITGRVTGELDPDGLYGVQVMAYDRDHTWVGSGWTDSDGRYCITGLEEGSYKVFFISYYNPAYGSVWYDGKADFDSADPVEVFIENETPGIDAHLVTGSISGTIISPEEPGGVSGVDEIGRAHV